MKVLNIEEYKTKCSKCGSTLLFTHDDIKKDWLDIDTWIVCPVCHNKEYLGSLNFYKKNRYEKEN